MIYYTQGPDGRLWTLDRESYEADDGFGTRSDFRIGELVGEVHSLRGAFAAEKAARGGLRLTQRIDWCEAFARATAQ